MEHLSHSSDNALAAQRAESTEERKDTENVAEAYCTPELFLLGKAVDLVQSSTSGKYSDGSTGYYWER
jgi:hypothetical protein